MPAKRIVCPVTTVACITAGDCAKGCAIEIARAAAASHGETAALTVIDTEATDGRGIPPVSDPLADGLGDILTQLRHQDADPDMDDSDSLAATRRLLDALALDADETAAMYAHIDPAVGRAKAVLAAVDPAGTSGAVAMVGMVYTFAGRLLTALTGKPAPDVTADIPKPVPVSIPLPTTQVAPPSVPKAPEPEVSGPPSMATEPLAATESRAATLTQADADAMPDNAVAFRAQYRMTWKFRSDVGPELVMLVPDHEKHPNFGKVYNAAGKLVATATPEGWRVPGLNVADLVTFGFDVERV